MKSKLKIGIIGIFFAVGIGFSILNQLKKSEKTSESKAKSEFINRQNFIVASLDLENFFRDPLNHSKWGLMADDCLKKYNLSDKNSQRLNCSSEILACVIDYQKKHKKKIFWGDAKIKISLNEQFTNQEEDGFRKILLPSIDQSLNVQSKNYQVQLITEEKKFNLNLESSCKESFLDERFFAIGPMPEDKESEIKFDNFNKKIFIDKYLVSYGDFQEWIELTSQKKIKIPAKIRFLPYGFLKSSEMKKYCSDHAKQILQSHYLDAASFMPFNFREKMPRSFERSDYFWSKKNSETWIAKFMKESRYSPNIQDCSLFYTKECAQKFSEEILDSEPTWSGIYQVMGGVFEYIENPLIARDNLRVASKYFSARSKLNKLGVRAYWDGKGHNLTNLEFSDTNELVDKNLKFEIGFRCMRQAR